MIAIAVVNVKSDLSIIFWRFALVTSIQGCPCNLAQLALQVGGPILRILQINSRKLALVWAKQKSSHCCLSCWFGCLTVKVLAACFLSCIWQMGQSGFQVFMWGINITPGFWVKVLPALCESRLYARFQLLHSMISGLFLWNNAWLRYYPASAKMRYHGQGSFGMFIDYVNPLSGGMHSALDE
jgi:hypothetical protein